MNNPKTYANQLVDEFRVILMEEDTDCGNEILCTIIAIKHAKIVVRELIAGTEAYSISGTNRLKYLSKVINELNNK